MTTPEERAEFRRIAEYATLGTGQEIDCGYAILALLDELDAAESGFKAEAEASRSYAADLKVAQADIETLLASRDQWEADADRALATLDRVRALPRYDFPIPPGVVVRADQLDAALAEEAEP